MGLERGKVALESYNPSWVREFEREASLLRSVFPSYQIEHVGSTAIPGLLAKPIIDIAICARSQDITDASIGKLHKLDYEERHTNPVPGRRFFAKGAEDDRTHYLHIVNKNEFDRLIKFRDSLRKNTLLAKKYNTLKRGLAKEHASRRELYTAAKGDFIRTVLEK